MGFNLDKNKLLSSIEKGVKNSSDVISDNDIASSVLEESTKPLDNILSSLNYSTDKSEEDNTMLVYDEDEEEEVWGSEDTEELSDDFDMSEDDEGEDSDIVQDDEGDEFDMSEDGDDSEPNTEGIDEFDMSDDEDVYDNEDIVEYTVQSTEDNDDFDMSEEDEEYSVQSTEDNDDFDMSEEDEEYTEEIVEENNDFDMSEEDEWEEDINSTVGTVEEIKKEEVTVEPTPVRPRATKGLKNINSTIVNTTSSDTEKGKQTLKVEDKVSIIDKGVKETTSEANIKGNVNYEKGMLLLEFLRLNPKIRTEKDVLEYFTKEDLKKEIVKGKVLVKKGKLII